MRRGLRLLLMALVCAALGGVYVLLGSAVAPAEAPASESTDAPGYFMLYEDSVAALESITVQPKGAQRYTAVSDMAFDQNGNLLGVYNALSQPFLVSGQEDFTFSTAAWQMLLLTAQHIPATATYPALDRDACGLTDPDAVITLTRKDGTTRVLRIGRLTSDGASCYVALDGDTNVYLVPYDFHETMVQPLNALHTLPSAIDESASAAVQIALTGTDDGQLIFTKSSGKLMAWSATSPIAHAGSTERIEAFITGLCAVSADEYVTTVADAAGLAVYGLDAPRRLIAAFQDGTIRDIHLGSDAGDGMVYARMDRTGDIYRIRRTQLTFAENAGLNTLLDRFVSPVVVATLSQVRVTTADGETTLRIEYEMATSTLVSAGSGTKTLSRATNLPMRICPLSPCSSTRLPRKKPQALPCWRMSPSPCVTAAHPPSAMKAATLLRLGDDRRRRTLSGSPDRRREHANSPERRK